MINTTGFIALAQRGVLTCLVGGALLLGCGDSSEPDAQGEPAAPSSSGDLSPSEEVKLVKVMSQAANAPVPVEMRTYAIGELGKLGTPDTVPALTLALMDPDPKIVAAAVAALPDTDDSAALEALRRASEHEDSKVSAAAKKRLRQLD